MADPNPTLINALADFIPPAWAAIIVSAGPTAWLWYRSWRKDHADRKERKTLEERKNSEDVRQNVDKQSIAIITEMRTEITLLTERLRNEERDHEATKKDRDRGWNRARWWDGRAHSMRHLYNGLLHAANLTIELLGKRYSDLATKYGEVPYEARPIQVPNIFLPGLEDPLPDEHDDTIMNG